MAKLSDKNRQLTFVPRLQSPDVAGFVKETSDDVVPDGWLEANGQAVSRTTYSELFAKIGTTYGVGDGSTTFNLPGGSLLTGNVGVNTTSPLGEFHITDGGTTPSLAAGAGEFIFQHNSNAADLAQLNVVGGTSGWSAVRLGDENDNTAGGMLYNHGSDYLRFDANSLERMRIDSTGKVDIIGGELDIGSVNLTSTIEMGIRADNGRVRIGDSVTASSNKAVRLGAYHYDNVTNTLPAGGFHLLSDSTRNLTNIGGGSIGLYSATEVNFYTAANNTTTTGTKRMAIDDEGRVRIGDSTVAESSLIIRGDSTDGQKLIGITENGSLTAFWIGGDFAGSGATGNELTFNSTWNERTLVLGGDGDVGIGLNPITRFHVEETHNGAADIRLTNTNAGNAAHCMHTFEANGGFVYMFKNSTARTTSAGGDGFAIQNETGGVKMAPGATAWSAVTSDERLKENITPLAPALDKIAQLNPVSYNWKLGRDVITEQTHLGFLAQELGAVFPEALETMDATEEELEFCLDGIKQTHNLDLIPHLVKAIQELKAEIDILKGV